jgi:predicted alpha/beta-hydrolase family hydrolase
MTEPERLTIQTSSRTVSGLWTPAQKAVAVAVVAHGAGAGMEHPFMSGVAESLAISGVSVLRFNFAYVEDGRRSPDRAPVLLDAWRSALQEAARRARGRPLVAGGKSLGGRIASMLAAEEGEGFSARALVFFGYPLHAPGKSDQPRDSHLPQIQVPILFIQGTNDALAKFDLVEGLVRKLAPLARLHAVEGGDHSFRVRGVRKSDHDIGRDLGSIAASFVHEIAD